MIGIRVPFYKIITIYLELYNYRPIFSYIFIVVWIIIILSIFYRSSFYVLPGYTLSIEGSTLIIRGKMQQVAINISEIKTITHYFIQDKRFIILNQTFKMPMEIYSKLRELDNLQIKAIEKDCRLEIQTNKFPFVNPLIFITMVVLTPISIRLLYYLFNYIAKEPYSSMSDYSILSFGFELEVIQNWPLGYFMMYFMIFILAFRPLIIYQGRKGLSINYKEDIITFTKTRFRSDRSIKISDIRKIVYHYKSDSSDSYSSYYLIFSDESKLSVGGAFFYDFFNPMSKSNVKQQMINFAKTLDIPIEYQFSVPYNK